MITDILGSLFVPHALAFFLLFKLATFEIPPTAGATMRENMKLLWRYVYPEWRKWLAHPLYWAACAAVTAFFLSGALWRVL
jgi:hypothetical protein